MSWVHRNNPRRVLGTTLADTNLAITACVPRKFSSKDWDFNNENKFRISEDQEKLAERVIAESQRVICETQDTSHSLKREVDHQLKERSIEIEFLIEELKKQKKTAQIEEESLKTYLMRVKNAKEFLRETSLYICEKCIILRENRLGVDLVNDEVDAQLRQELKIIQGCQGLIQKTLEQTTEQIRRLRATIYLLDRDLSNKDMSLRIDETNLRLRENQQEMSMYLGKVPLDQCSYTLNEWQHQTYKNIENTAKELNSAIQIRSYVDILLKQVVEDMKTQTERTNEAFARRINEVRHVKDKLELVHNETIKHINDVNKNITSVEKQLAETEGYLVLCQMRLGNRAQRPGLELTCDGVQDALLIELTALKETVGKLNQKRAELKATLRYLLHAQILQEEELNIKTNSLKIDEVDCVTIREVLHYQSF